jgi:hypothetical protein
MAEKIIEVMPKKEIVVLQKTAKDVSGQATLIQVNSQNTLIEANNILERVKEGKKYITEKKKTITDPLNQALKATRELFLPIEAMILFAENLLKGKILDYKQKIDKEVAEKKEEIAQKVESGEIKFEAGAKKMEKQEEKISNFKTRKIRQVEIIDEKKIPREYLMPNMIKIKEDMLEKGINVDGCQIVTKEIAIA